MIVFIVLVRIALFSLKRLIAEGTIEEAIEGSP